MSVIYTFRQLSYFVAVAQTGSITQASKKVNVSAPSISSSIKQLEDILGVQLFVRIHAQGLILTPIGKIVSIEAQRLISEAEKLHKTAGDMISDVKGVLRIGCLTTVAPMILPELRKKFEEQFPTVIVQQFEGDHINLIEGLRSGELDICLTYDLEKHPSIEFIPLFELPPYALFPANHTLADKKIVKPEDLSEEPLILLDLPASGAYFLSMFRSVGLTPYIVERVSDIALARSMVANGFGYSLANIHPFINKSPDGKELIFVSVSADLRPLNLVTATNRLIQKSGVVKTFESHCRVAIKQDKLSSLYFS